MGPFDFWSAGTDSGVPDDAHWRVRPGLLVTIAGVVVVIILLAVFVNP
jgi:hypothetical protein